MTNFYLNQKKQNRELYLELLSITGSLSNLYSDNNCPFIYYRAMENIFCKAFGADNYSRSDISADAGKDGIGIGLKTFLQNNGYTFQKVAEFNKESHLLEGLDDLELALKISKMRNERIESTKRICNLDEMIYHLLTRSEGRMSLYEENMDLIDIDNIEITKKTKTTLHFKDGINEYNFNKSKSTLLKRFNTRKDREIVSFPVEILLDPFDYLLNIPEKSILIKDAQGDYIEKGYKNYMDYIILPLYSPREDAVPKKSGLNQWNAAGRKRHPDEVYIPIPSWIHKYKSQFFKGLYNTKDNKTKSFNVELPNKKVISMRVAQQGGKALMSNPNRDLGKWILRDILNLPQNTLVTKEMLDIIGIDSVMLSKNNSTKFKLDFLKSGSYEEFEDENNII